MKSVEEFKSFYDSVLTTELEPIEEQRKLYVAKTWHITFIWIGGLIAAAGLGLLLIYLAALPIIGMIVMLVIHYKKRSVIGKFILTNFKKNVIEKTLHNINDSLNFYPEKYMSQSTFAESKIFTNSGSRYKGDDYVTGTVGQTEISFSEIHAEDYTKDKDGKKQYYTIFKGVLFVADFHKNFVGETFVLTDTAEKMLGGLGKMFQKMNISRPELVKLENVTFEKQFVVYGTDQVEARYIITPVLMETMLQLNENYNNVQFSFINSKIFITIPQKKNMFEPNYYSTLLNFDYLKEYYELLYYCISLVGILELNNRIWTKE